MKTIPFGSGRDAVEFAKLDWPNLHRTHAEFEVDTISANRSELYNK